MHVIVKHPWHTSNGTSTKNRKKNKIERVAYFHWHGRYQELSRFRPWSQNSREHVLSRFLFGLCLIFVKSLHITPEKYKTKSWWIIITQQNIAEIIFLYMETHKKRSCFISRQGTNIKTDHLALQTLGICQIMKQQKSENNKVLLTGNVFTETAQSGVPRSPAAVQY